MPTFRDFAALVRLDPETLREKVNQLLLGKTNNVGEFEVLAATTSTTVLDDLVSPASLIVMTAYTDVARASDVWISDQGAGTFTVTHTAHAQGVGIVRYAVTG